MSMNLKEFKAAIEREKLKLVETLGKEAQLAAGQYVYERILIRTPVLSGHARHNWRPSVNEQVYGEQEGVFGGEATGEPITATERARWKDVAAEIKAQPLGQTVWISNNVPYAQRLEHGWSKKAPTGMIAVTLIEVLEGVYRNQVRLMGNDSSG